jgi:uncharacterized cupredoxin-like copper-binding protein
VLAAVSTEHKIAMLVVAGIFIGFALASSFLFPRYWPQYPGKGLGAFIAVSVALTVAMLLAVEFFAVEEEEAEAGTEAAEVRETTEATTTTTATATATEAETETEAETAPTTTEAAPARQTVAVSGTEFAFALNPSDVEPGAVVFRLENDGQIGHDLAIEGPGVEEKTPVIDPGETAQLEVELEPGDYELYCSVPGHREGGMEVDLEVG